MSAPRKSRYRQADGRHLIEVRIRTPAQLFDARDPAPFRERDLDDDLVEYVVASAREVPRRAPVRIVIHIDEPEKKEFPKSAIREAIHDFLAYRIEMQRSELRLFLRRAQIALLLGLVTLSIFLSIAQSLQPPSSPGALGILREGFIILGWVSMWKPIELVMFDWYPLFDTRRLFQRLLEAEVEIKFAPVAGA